MFRSRRPRSRDDFEIAIICALRIECDAVETLFDENWEEDPDQSYGKAQGDLNAYTIGRIGVHNVVLACMPGMGKGSSASVAASFRSSFPRIRLGLVVGVCGGAPKANDNIYLGDVIISTGIVEIDSVQQYPDARKRRDTIADSLGRPPLEIRSFLQMIEGRQSRKKLEKNITVHLQEIQEQCPAEYVYPGATEDYLFPSDYRHRHRGVGACTICSKCTEEGGDVCETALYAHCDKLQCRQGDVKCRIRQDITSSSTGIEPRVYFGNIASSDTLMKSAAHRDEFTETENVVAFEMEGAGVWENFPTVVIKGVCDYSDSHKQKTWQPYAAATAAACTKALLQQWRPTDKPHSGSISDLSTFLPGRQFNETTGQAEARTLKDNTQGLSRCHQSFKTSNYECFKDVNPKKVHDTCKWVLDNPKFKSWCSSTHDDLLWISADPGCGKSVLAKSLIDDDLASGDSRTTCYFFFKDNEDQNKLHLALCAVLHQLFAQKPELLPHALKACDGNGTSLQWEVGEMWRILLSAVKDPAAGNVILIFDALDECEYRDRHELVGRVKDFYTDPMGNEVNTTKFIITSRSYGDIRESWEGIKSGITTIRLAGENESDTMSQEINLVIEADVDELAINRRLPRHVKEGLKTQLRRTPHRTYLWLYLVMQQLRENTSLRATIKSYETATRSLPRSVGEAYENILKKSRNEEETKRLLSIIVGAERPLKVAEINVALQLANDPDAQAIADLDLEDHRKAKERIRNICGLFVFIKDSRVYLIHQTAKEFLLQSSDQKGDPYPSRWSGFLTYDAGQDIMTTICIRYMRFMDFSGMLIKSDGSILYHGKMYRLEGFRHERPHHWVLYRSNPQIIPKECSDSEGAEELPGKRRSQTKKLGKSLRKLQKMGLEFLLYCSFYWPRHYVNASAVCRTTMSDAAISIHNQSTTVGLIWIPYYLSSHGFQVAYTRTLESMDESMDIKVGCNALESAFFCEHKNLIEDVLAQDTESTISKWIGYDMIFDASYKGDADSMRFVFDHCPDLSRDSVQLNTLMYHAINGTNLGCVKLLLERGSNPDHIDDIFGTLLIHAISYRGVGPNGVDISRLLIEKGASIDLQDRRGCTALMVAAEFDNMKATQLLIANGASPDLRDNDGRTALSLAKNERIKHLLIAASSSSKGKRKRKKKGKREKEKGSHQKHGETLARG